MSIDKRITEYADEVSDRDISSAGPHSQQSLSKRVWTSWVVDPAATKHICADLTELPKYTPYSYWDRPGVTTSEGFYNALGYGRVSLALKKDCNGTTNLFPICYFYPLNHSVFSLYQASEESHIRYDQSTGILYNRSQNGQTVGYTERIGNQSVLRLREPIFINVAGINSPEPRLACLMVLVLLFSHVLGLT